MAAGYDVKWRGAPEPRVHHAHGVVELVGKSIRYLTKAR